ncbi:MAG TPA: hypothetical protein HPP77_10495 [Candidatus Hydrogenedentes bacterium]|nr:hypothetical protein [Candidatus Hydrogenedentota bacterium]HIJ73766.1 hypothetical protein [Candidatus Hydrogenedentota bacterium]
MGCPDESLPAALDVWLEAATKDLCEEAKARIRPEIEAHYHEALDEELGRGLNEDEARTAAIASLGSPKAARKAFLRIHFTKREAAIINRLRTCLIDDLSLQDCRELRELLKFGLILWCLILVLVTAAGFSKGCLLKFVAVYCSVSVAAAGLLVGLLKILVKIARVARRTFPLRLLLALRIVHQLWMLVTCVAWPAFFIVSIAPAGWLDEHPGLGRMALVIILLASLQWAGEMVAHVRLWLKLARNVGSSPSRGSIC